MADHLIDFVDENDNVVGTAMRSAVHRDKKPFRLVHVWFITPEGDLILQRRGLQKDTHPGLLTSTVSGHVEAGHTYEQTAVKETFEETGIVVQESDLRFLGKFKLAATTHGPTFRAFYGVVFKGSLDDLVVEAGEAEGFATLKVDTIFDLSEEEKKKYAPTILNRSFYEPIYAQLAALIK